MIVRMSKIEIAGLKSIMQDVISVIQDMGILHIESSITGFIEDADKEWIKPSAIDENILSEKLFLENMKARINELYSYIPFFTSRKSYLKPEGIIDTISRLLTQHLDTCRRLFNKRESLKKEVSEVERYSSFLNVIESLLHNIEPAILPAKAGRIDFIGITLKNASLIDYLRSLLSYLTGGKFELFTGTMDDGSVAGLIVTNTSIGERVRMSLSEEHIPEITFPPSITGLTFIEKIRYLKRKITELNEAILAINNELERFSRRWVPIYERILEWIDERLSLIKVTAQVFETRICFFIYGWIPKDNLEQLVNEFNRRFGHSVTVTEKEIFEEDLERIPVILRNPPYFRPFELFMRLLPPPKYTSLDPTPFIAIFFPVFFGMILGDCGYGLILLILSSLLMQKFRKKRDILDASKILFICSLYSIFFGILYGEFFGELGETLLGMKPLCIERRTSVIPMLYFVLTVGTVHIIMGLFLGFLSSLKKKAGKEATVRLINILIIISSLLIIAGLFDFFPHILTKPLIVLILILSPILLFTGGLLAPLELIKSIGNIISYARIMAIGLTSVLLAFVANRIAGMTGDIITGLVAALILHLVNTVIGVFSPAIHSLRLHYVEFFSKFLETGGRRFEPLKK